MLKKSPLISIPSIIALCAVILSGCSLKSPTKTLENQEPTSQIEPATETPQEPIEKTTTPTPKPTTKTTIKTPTKVEPPAEQTAKYKIEFLATWSSRTHPNYYPSDAHFSPFVAYAHNNSSQSHIFTKDQKPTPGVEEMAETGATEILINEIQNIIDSNFAYQQTKGKRTDSPGNDSSLLELSQNFSYITFVSMLAPSPDWFVASSTNLFQNGKWLEKIELDLLTYDAGGDDGKLLTSPDKDSNPTQPITIFNKDLQNLGKIILTKF